MEFGEHARRELELARKRLRDEIKKLEEDLRAVDRILNGAQSAVLQLPLAEGSPVTTPPDLRTMGLRTAIRVIMRGASQEMNVHQILKALEAGGFKTTGKTPLRLKVSSELSRMLKTGDLVKVDRGLYRSGEESSK